MASKQTDLEQALVKRARGRGAVVVAAWMTMNALLAAPLFFFVDFTKGQQVAVHWAAISILAITSLTLLLVPRPSRRPRAVSHQASGATAAALAISCFFGALAWVYGEWMLYLALPLLAFCVGRWRIEWKERRAR